jgi:proline iminopeptidase
MPAFSAFDGTELAYRVAGEGAPVICLPGGPMEDSVYLGDLGGLSAHRRLVLLDPRGTGQSAVPADETSYRCDRQVDDVEALREHLALERFDLLGHSAGANVAMRYLERHPERVGKLALLGPSTRAVGIETTGEARREIALLRAGEPWYEEAIAALDDIQAGKADEAHWRAIDPLFCGRWDATAQAFQGAHDSHQNHAGAAVFGADGAFDPEATRAALRAFDGPVLLLAGEVDVNTPPRVAADVAELFANVEFVIQPGAGHFPWLDDADTFVATVSGFFNS